MPPRARSCWGALSMVLILAWDPPRPAQACPHPCACYVPSEVHCTFRSLAAVPAGISKDVERINLGFNSIQAVAQTSFSGLSKLELLMMHGNDVASLPDGALQDLSSLQVFKFSYNKLRDITRHTLRGLSRLVRLHADHNRIEFIHPEALRGLTALRLVHLEGNLLHRLHPSTFSTFSFLGHFHLSAVRHLYLGDNALRSLPDGMLGTMPLLDTLHLHGNPWACGCDMRWLLGWGAGARGVLRCKKDKAYEGGQLCAQCSSPEKLRAQEIHTLGDVQCSRPVIESPLRGPGGEEDEEDAEEEEEEDEGAFSADRVQLPAWSASLNLTDEQGNAVNLTCAIRPPAALHELRLNQTADALTWELDATVRLDLGCPVDRSSYERLWKLIAYYSEAPLKLRAARSPPQATPCAYAQDSDDGGAPYYTGVRAELRAQPAWVAQPAVQLQLDRRRSSARRVLLTYYARFSQTVPDVAQDAPGRTGWVMLLQPDAGDPRALTVLEGGSFQLSCECKASARPAIFWALPDGSVLHRDPQEGDRAAAGSRVSILPGGQLSVQEARSSDAGLYQCVARVQGDTDRGVYRVAVQAPVPRVSGARAGTVERRVGEPLALPCRAPSIPEARISWVLPGGALATQGANASRAHVLRNGTLHIPRVRAGDAGAYTCVAVNLRGADRLTVQVAVRKRPPGRAPKGARRPGGGGGGTRRKPAPRTRGDVVEDQGGSGEGGGEDPAPQGALHVPDAGAFTGVQEERAPAQKGARRPNVSMGPRREPEASAAEGRRAFESRRRVHVANKQIHPQRWADILARVRGRNAPKGTQGPRAPETSTPASLGAEEAPPPAAAAPPWTAPAGAPTALEEASADTSLLGEDELTDAPTGATLGRQAHGAEASGSRAPSLESAPERAPPAETHDPGVSRPLPPPFAPQPLDAEPAPPLPTPLGGHPAPGTSSWVQPGTPVYLSADPTLETETAMPARSPPSPAWQAPLHPGRSSWLQELGVPSVPVPPPDSDAPIQGDMSIGGASTMHGMPGVPGTGTPLGSRPAESSPPQGGKLGRTDPVVQWEPTTPDWPLGRTALTLATPPTPPSRRRPSGRRRGRPQKWHPREKPKADASGQWGVGTPPPAGPATPGTPRKKQRQHRPDPLTPQNPEGDPSPRAGSPPESGPPNATTPGPTEALLSPTTAPGKMGGPPEPARGADDQSVNPNVHRAPSQVLETSASPAPPGTAREGAHGVTHVHVVSAPRPTEPAPGTPSSSGPAGSTAAALEEAGTPTPSGVSEPPSWTSPRTARPRSLDTGSPVGVPPVPSASEATHPAPKLGTGRPEGGAPASTVHPEEGLGSPSGHAEATARGQGQQSPTLTTVHVEISPPPALPGGPESPSPALWPLPEMTTKSVPRLPWTRPAASDRVLFNSARAQGTWGPLLSSEVTVQPHGGPAVHWSSQDAPDSPPPPGKTEDELSSWTASTGPWGPAVQPRDGAGATHSPRRPDVTPTHTAAPRGTAWPPPVSTQSPPKREGTSKPPQRPTNQPDMTERPWRVWAKSRPFLSPHPPPSTPSEVGGHGTPKVSPSNDILGVPVGKPPASRPPPAPPRSGGPFLSFALDRTLGSPHWAAPPKPPAPSTALPAAPSRRASPGSVHRVFSHSSYHVDLGPPAPPRVHLPRATPPPLGGPHKAPPAPATRSPAAWFTASAGPPSRNARLGGSRDFSEGGPPASTFWTLGAKPEIITKSAPTADVAAETDAVFPCEATGKPTPIITWTKVSTGVLLTPSARLQRFEVQKNGSLVIHQVQVQDQGRYVCTARNVHGVDTMPVLLTVSAQRPRVPAPHYQDVTVYLGASIAMECLARGTPAPQISWISPDRRVWHAGSPGDGRVTLHPNRTLSIREAALSDRGVYQCVASNAAGADSLAIRLHVAALPPAIQEEPQELLALPAGLSVSIPCTARAAPPARVRWVLGDGSLVRPSQFVRGNLFVFPNGTLYIRHLAPGDSGRYDCVATNALGAARRSVQLRVGSRPAQVRITGTSPRSTHVRYGAALRLHCSAAGDPRPRTQWRLPSQRVVHEQFSPDPRVQVFANGTLLVQSVTDKDGGEYVCIARNRMGDDSVALQVHVVMQPAKIARREDAHHRVAYGDDLKVDCVATGLPNPEVTWSLPDGSVVHPLLQADDGGAGARAQRYLVFNNGTLLLNEVGTREQGDYTCLAQNQVGRDRMTVRVHVLAQPAPVRLQRDRSAVQVRYGEVVSVPCPARGEPAPQVTWLSPRLRPIPAASDKYHVSPDGTLLLRRAQRSDDGNYTCVVRSGAGEARQVVWIQVLVQPPRINGHPGALATAREAAPAGSRKLLPCSAQGIPAPRAFWAFPGGVVLPAPYRGSRVAVHDNGTLDIRRVRPSDAARLQCIARNEGGEARLVVQLTVQDPLEKPAFQDPASERITAWAGHTINLNCSASGTPAPWLLWVLPNGTEVPPGARRLQRFLHREDGRLHISALEAGDAGGYRCQARNAAGRAERLVSLRVAHGAPGAVSVLHGETLQLPCALLAARRPARVSWTLPSGLVLHAPGSAGRFSAWENGTLAVRAVSLADRGAYACRVDTERGPAVLTTPVVVLAAPPRVTGQDAPVVYARAGSSVRLSCAATGLPRAHVAWQLPDRSLLPAGPEERALGNKLVQPQGALTIQRVSARDAGFYRCLAHNELGKDARSTYVHVL
ncbi:matrix-remodeling-associated protein 5-like [Tenrec ecaudatus]|uniref:matrix-remodeling-associated protein 5-like n=1 Tax=Tenrec ecaudatus TaxID=94439 RepID=UPI003F59FB14